MRVIMKQKLITNKTVAVMLLLTFLVVGMLFALAPQSQASALEPTEQEVVMGEVIEQGVVRAGGAEQPSGQKDPQEVYNGMREGFYQAFNTYIIPTLILVGICMFIFAGTKLGIEMGKAEDDAKRAEIKKRMVSWGIGIVVVMISPLLVQAIAEIAMGFSSGLWGSV